MSPTPDRARDPWAWIPSLYLAEGLPYVVVMTVSVIMYKSFGLSNTDIALYTSWLYLPWVIKPLWSPVVDILATRRRWIWVMQVVIGGGLAGVAFGAPLPDFLRWTMAFFWLLAFASATHDIAADGFYMLATTERQQATFVGVRTMFYRIATIAGQGLMVMLAGTLQKRSGDAHAAWSLVMGVLAALFLGFGLWHRFVLPRTPADRPGEARRIPEVTREFLGTFGSFFAKPRIAVLILFLLLYRFGEAQLVKMTSPFLLDARAKGGLALTTTEVGFIYGTIGVIALTLGGILGGWVVARQGLGRWLWIMLLAIHLPDAAFIYLAYAQPTNLPLVQLAIAVEQFGYGFGFTAYLMYMIHIARGRYPTAHYAICTGFMALGMMIPGMWSGWLADHIGYRHFFLWVVLATIPSFVVAMWIPLEPEFGRKADA
ncbi:MAG: AmpG family muropeptide MFS transporter [Candidatus Eisenbacteria bacterium]|uniref:AmpG family muropeptide MFS transporter n=1 Tax=Eiseniibacteriota bacterium TaxID=2212470 RepID=A0A9D6QPU8_UNCEI|nr:AmpG family muropeptide MFS transporter [Candidatus Eisenbacteria bacterium]MBI3540279.1 AmpG family muropeptide MFS transporter [Candidatus Eisenbacteria bacterium]